MLSYKFANGLSEALKFVFDSIGGVFEFILSNDITRFIFFFSIVVGSCSLCLYLISVLFSDDTSEYVIVNARATEMFIIKKQRAIYKKSRQANYQASDIERIILKIK